MLKRDDLISKLYDIIIKISTEVLTDLDKKNFFSLVNSSKKYDDLGSIRKLAIDAYKNYQ